MARLDRQICETLGRMAQTLTACEQCCDDDTKALQAEQTRLEVECCLAAVWRQE